MSDEEQLKATLVGAAGRKLPGFLLLATLSEVPQDPEGISSAVYRTTIADSIEWDLAYETDSWLTAIDGNPSGTLYAVSAEGEVHVRRGSKWKTHDLKCPDGLSAVWAASEDEAFAVGFGGERIRLTGDAPEQTRDAKRRRINAVHGSAPTHVVAVGNGGLVTRFDGKRWVDLDPPAKADFLSVWCRSETETFIAGAGGAAFRWDGRTWTRLEGAKGTVSSLTVWRDGTYAACGKNGVFLLKGNRFEPFKDRRVDKLWPLEDRLIALGDNFMALFDGAAWKGAAMHP